MHVHTHTHTHTHYVCNYVEVIDVNDPDCGDFTMYMYIKTLP